MFNRDHTDDVVCLAYHPGRKIVVTGEQGKTPAVIVWDATTGGTLAILKGFHKRAVISVAFNSDGSKVASVGLDDDHSLAVYDWCAGALLATAKGDTNRILDIQNNTSRDANPQTDFVTVGVKHIKFWSLENTGTLIEKRGLLGTKGEQKALLTVGFTTLYSCVGTADGEIYLFEGNKLTKVLDAHQRHLYALKGFGDVLYSGGRDGYVSMWNMNNQKKLSTISMNKYEAAEVMSTATNAIRALDISSDGTVLVGTITSSIYAANMRDLSATKILTSHFGDVARPRCGRPRPTEPKRTFFFLPSTRKSCAICLGLRFRLYPWK
jgi:microtubule-associated protein-like 6